MQGWTIPMKTPHRRGCTLWWLYHSLSKTKLNSNECWRWERLDLSHVEMCWENSPWIFLLLKYLSRRVQKQVLVGFIKRKSFQPIREQQCAARGLWRYDSIRLCCFYSIRQTIIFFHIFITMIIQIVVWCHRKSHSSASRGEKKVAAECTMALKQQRDVVMWAITPGVLMFPLHLIFRWNFFKQKSSPNSNKHQGKWMENLTVNGVSSMNEPEQGS